MSKILIYVFISQLLFISQLAFSQQSALTIDQLLENVEQGIISDIAEHKIREAEFRQKKEKQESLLADAETTKVTGENRATQLDAIFEENEAELNILQDTLAGRLGALQELFGVMQLVAGDARTSFDNSLTNVQYPDRGLFLEELVKKIDSKSVLPSTEDIDRLFFELQREMVMSGEVVKFATDVIDAKGNIKSTEVVRVGKFHIVADGKYLTYSPKTGRVSENSKQPRFDYKLTSKNFYNKNDENQKVEFVVFLSD